MKDTERFRAKAHASGIRSDLLERVETLARCDLFSDHFKSHILADKHTSKYISVGKDFCAPAESAKELKHTIILLFANRSGSNFLADLIASTGYYNVGGEQFNWPVVQKLCNKESITSFAGYLDRIKRRAVDGRFAVKASLYQYMFLYASSMLESHFPNRTVVVIERGDKLAQAISLWIAMHTNQWTSEHSTEWHGEVPFDPDKLSRLVGREFDHEKDARIAMSLLNEKCVTARYEEFQRDPVYTVKRVLGECGITGRIELDKDALTRKKQSNDLNASLRRQFVAKFGPAA